MENHYRSAWLTVCMGLLCFGVLANDPVEVLQKVAKGKQKPNVVLILIDDLSYFGVSAYGARRISSAQGHFKDMPFETPRIDQLAEEGVLCTEAYAHPLCESTRIALMTGKHGGRNYIRCKSLHESHIIFSDVFKQEGYATGMYGKWKQTRGTKEVSGEKYISQFGWDDYACFDVAHKGGKWQRFINPDLVINDTIVSYNGRKDVDPETGRRWYGPDICNRKALQFIENHKDEPFFMYYPMILVHDDHKPTPDSQPHSIFDNIDESIKVDERIYFPDMVFYMDKLIGKVVDKLDELGIRENTMVIVMGDNGNKEVFQFTHENGAVYGGGKGHTRFHGEQVPMVFSWPHKIPTASNGERFRKYEGIIDLTDIYTTMFDACGITPPNADKVDGVSLFPQLVDPNKDFHRAAIYKWYNANNKIEDETQKVRFAQTPDFKYYGPHDIYPEGRFFDLRVDSLEQAGEKGLKLGWQNYFYSGIPLDELTAEQEAAYKMLKKVVEAHEYVAIQKLAIKKAKKQVGVGDLLQLNVQQFPKNVTMNSVIWESSDPSIATIDKFGRLKAHKSGEVTVTVYSWDDAYPLADNGKVAYKKGGVQDKMTVKVINKTVQ